MDSFCVGPLGVVGVIAAGGTPAAQPAEIYKKKSGASTEAARW